MKRLRAGTAAAVGTIALGLFGPAPTQAAVAYPAPGRLPVATATTMDERYGATRQSVREALALAVAEDDSPRAASLELLVERDLFEFDARGNGRAIEVIGDLPAADRIAVVVPGSHTTLDTFNRNRGPGGSAQALADEIRAVDPGARVAVVGWLGYDAPQGASPHSLTDGLAHTGADALRATVTDLRRVNPDASIGLLCHSYGSVVCAEAAPEQAITDLAIYGSPGVGVRSVAALDTTARVWAGRTTEDWIRYVPSVRLAGIGFGTDPVDPAFGALVFPAGDGGHGDYHLPGSQSLRNLTWIALGSPESVEVRNG